MKKYIRALLNEMSKKRHDYTPPIPKASGKSTTEHLDPPPVAPVPEDLNNQQLSNDPSERVRQLDYQAQRLEEKGDMPG